MTATLVVAAHGTESVTGSATTAALVRAVSLARPDTPVRLCFLDVAAPRLAQELDILRGAELVVVPLLLSAGYHVLSDIPAIAQGRDGVRVAAHLGPDPAMVDAVAARLAEARGTMTPASTVLAAIESSRASARAEVAAAADQLAARLGRPVPVLPLGGELPRRLAEFPGPVEVAVYLLAEGGFLGGLREAAAGHGVVAAPIGVHPALVRLIWDRYDQAPPAPDQKSDEGRHRRFR